MIRHKNGFTLMELMVYMAILGIIVIVAGRAFSDSTKFRVRTQNILEATQEAENVATIFKADVAQLGAKSSKEAGAAVNGIEAGDNFSNIYNDVYRDAANGDFSSFLITSSSGQSDLTFRRVRYGEDGSYRAVEEINWFVDANKVLKRSCRTINNLTPPVDVDVMCPEGSAQDARDNAVRIATNVDEFKVTAASPAADAGNAGQQIFPTPGNEFRLIPRTGGEHFFNFKSENSALEEKGADSVIALSQFYTNYDNANGEFKAEPNRNQVFAVNSADYPGPGLWSDYCENRGLITFQAGHTYEISFEVPFISMSPDPNVPLQAFVPGVDHMSVGLRGSDGEYLRDSTVSPPRRLMDDFLFFPPYNAQGSGKRYMRFTTPVNATGCLALTFACYSPKASQATIQIKNLKVSEISGQNYMFDDAFDPETHADEKQYIKALQLKLQITRGAGETSEIEMVVHTPSNGPRD